jgi:putative transposase
MPYRKFELHANEYYHLYNRGNNHASIFRETENYRYFLRLLEKYLPPDRVEIIAYCLMPDHYHLLVCPRDDSLSKLMQPLLLAYTNAVNRRYGRAGSLFQGRFKVRLIGNNEYLLHLSRYIHLNPVRAGLTKKAEDWEFSSYRAYLGSCSGVILRPEVVLGQFNSPQEYREFVEEELQVEPPGFQELVFDK